MKQSALNHDLYSKKTRKQVLLKQMEQVVPRPALVEFIAPSYPEGKIECAPFPLQTMQRWFKLADQGMEVAFCDPLLYWDFTPQGHGLLHREDQVVFADAGYKCASKRPKATCAKLQVAKCPGKRAALYKNYLCDNLLDRTERMKASVRAKMKHSFLVNKCQFGFSKVRCKGLANNTAQLVTLFALSNSRTVRRQLFGAHG